MIKCPNCGHENDPKRTTCIKCGYNLYTSEQDPPEPDAEEVERLRTRIKELEAEVIRLGKEVAELTKKFDEVKPGDDHPIVHELREEILTHIGEIEGLQKLVGFPTSGPGTEIAIDSFPDANPTFHLVLDHHTDSIDLSSSPYRIRGNLERTRDGLEIVAHKGATVNVKASQKGDRWTRLKDGNRTSVDAGTILFDPSGARNARLSIKP
jgi:hypothetical protein